MNVLLVHAWTPDIFPPPAIGCLRSFLEAQDSSIQVFSSYANLRSDLPDWMDYIGISVHTFSVPTAVKLVNQLRSRYPEARLIAGGHHASALPQQMFDIGFDQVVVGPGETALADIVLGDNKSLLVQGGSRHVRMPNYEGLDECWTMPSLSSGQGRGIGVLSSRGCPFSCSFCASANFWKHQWHPMTTDEVIESLESQVRFYNLQSWMFEDDNFTLKPGRAIEICERIKRSEILGYGKMPWQAASRAESLCSVPLCEALASAGCKCVWLGVESLSQASLDRCNKHTQVEAVINGIDTARRHGLQTVNQFIVGLPGDTEDDINITRDRLTRHGIKAAVNCAWILPGTAIYSHALTYRFKDEAYLTYVPYYTYEWPAGTLDRWKSILSR